MLFILFGMHERDPSTKEEFDIIYQMSLVCVLVQRFKQSTKLITKVTNTKIYA